LAIRFAVETIPPFLMAGTRFLIAGCVLYVFRRFLMKDTPPLKIEWRSAAIVGLFLLVGGNGAVTWAEQRVPSGIAALLVASAPLWMVLLDAIRPGRQRPAGWTLAGVLLGFFGIIVLVGPAQFFGNGGQVDPVGALALTFAAFSWAIGSLYNRGARLPGSPLLSTGMEMLAGGLGLVLLGTLTGEWSRLDLAEVSARSLATHLIRVHPGGLWPTSGCYAWLHQPGFDLCLCQPTGGNFGRQLAGRRSHHPKHPAGGCHHYRSAALIAHPAGKPFRTGSGGVYCSGRLTAEPEENIAWIFPPARRSACTKAGSNCEPEQRMISGRLLPVSAPGYTRPVGGHGTISATLTRRFPNGIAPPASLSGSPPIQRSWW
jgi:hypothetical protein